MTGITDKSPLERVAETFKQYMILAQSKPNDSLHTILCATEAANFLDRAGLVSPGFPEPTFTPTHGLGASWEIGQAAIYNWEDGGESICIQIGDFGFKFNLAEAEDLANALRAAVITAPGYRYG
ncbi:hypothetical protein [Corynebacterium sp.]|uniref:hypothetical protein n=1 Tax=Corynebacterium sp. TaxID=1720 RepID=UPI0028AAE61E|nr:hypothetical protein [Corynebacterium sp.]